MHELLFTSLGTGFLLLVARDVYVTILHARGRSGPLAETVCRSVWFVARAIAFKLSRPRRHKLLNAVGPVLMPILIGTFISLLIIGFSLIYVPRMPAQFSVDPEAKSAVWIQSLYFSGITLTTVGYGDIAPRSVEMRLLALFEASTGFTLISLSVSYLVAVYNALERKRAIALAFYHKAEGGADAVGFITHYFFAGRFHGIEESLRTAARDLQRLLEAHIEHPIIHYFHPTEVYKGLPRVLFLSLEVCNVIKSCLDEREYSEISNHPEVITLEASARQVLIQLNELLGLKRTAPQGYKTHIEESEFWRRRFEQALHRLNDAGIKTQEDTEKGWEAYRAGRDEWETALRRLARFLGYDWAEVAGDDEL